MKYEYRHELLKKYEKEALNNYVNVSYKFEKDYLINKCDSFNLEIEHKNALYGFIDYLQTDLDLKRYIYIKYYILFESQEEFYNNLFGYGLCTVLMPLEIEEKFAGLSDSILFLLAIDNLNSFLTSNNYSKERTQEILEYYKEKFRTYTQIDHLNLNIYGIKTLWPHLYTYAKPTTFKLGRLVFQLANVKDFVEVYEYNNSLKIVALPKLTYDETGHCNKNGTIVPTYKIENNFLYANNVDENGLLTNKIDEIDLTKYKLILKPKDNVLTIHIPPEGKLNKEEVDKSLTLAKKSISLDFKKYNVKGIVCYTWLLDTSLKEFLKENSNILSFQNRFKLIMNEDNTIHSLFNHVFNVKEDGNLDNLKPTNSFQSTMLERVKNGKKIYLGYGILK